MKRTLRKNYLTEGGNVFNVEVSAVPKESLKPTLNKALKDSGMEKTETHLVGNISKPFLGDIDVAVEHSDLISLFGSNGENKDFWDKADKYLKKQKIEDYFLNKGLQQIHILTPIVNKAGKQLPAYDKSGKQVGKVGYAQIDLMIGNASFMKDSLKGAENSKYKSIWRNILLADILSNTISGDDESEIKHKFQINWKTGLQYVRFKMSGKTKKKLNTKTVMTDMDDVASYMFGKKYKFKDIDTFEKLWGAFNSSTFRWKNKRKDIIKSYKKTLERMKMDVPSELNESYALGVLNVDNDMIKTLIAKSVLEELENGNEKIVELMKSHEGQLELNESISDTFVEDTIKALKEHLGIDEQEQEPTACESELERMRRLIG